MYIILGIQKILKGKTMDEMYKKIWGMIYFYRFVKI
jgi:hypothetical protein